MKKQTSQKISSLAARYMKIRGADLHGKELDALEQMAADFRRMAASLLSQDEEGPTE